MNMQARDTGLRSSVGRYRFGGANNNQIPKHKLSKSEVRVGLK